MAKTRTKKAAAPVAAPVVDTVPVNEVTPAEAPKEAPAEEVAAPVVVEAPAPMVEAPVVEAPAAVEPEPVVKPKPVVETKVKEVVAEPVVKPETPKAPVVSAAKAQHDYNMECQRNFTAEFAPGNRFIMKFRGKVVYHTMTSAVRPRAMYDHVLVFDQKYPYAGLEINRL